MVNKRSARGRMDDGWMDEGRGGVPKTTHYRDGYTE